LFNSYQAIVILHPLAAVDSRSGTAFDVREARGSNTREKDRSFLFYNICRKCFAGGVWGGSTFLWDADRRGGFADSSKQTLLAITLEVVVKPASAIAHLLWKW